MQKRKIMIVDDEENILRALERALMDEDYVVETATNANEAIEKMKIFNAQIVLSDNMMPGMSGIELLQQVRDCYPGTIGMLITGRSDVQISIAAINQGEIFRFLLKPWDDEELKMTLRNAFQYRELLLENNKLSAMVKKQSDQLEEIEKRYPGITKVDRQDDGSILFEDEDSSDIIQTFQIKG